MNEELDDTYKVVFRQCYPKLLFYATRLVGTEEAEDVVQDVFVELWRRRDSVVIGEQILAFLYRSVYTKIYVCVDIHTLIAHLIDDTGQVVLGIFNM